MTSQPPFCNSLFDCRRSGVQVPVAPYVFNFVLTKWYKSIYILDPEVEPIPIIKFVFGYDHSGSFPPKKLRQGSTLSRNLGLKLFSEMAHIQSPFLLFYELHDGTFFSFSSKIEGVTVPAHF